MVFFLKTQTKTAHPAVPPRKPRAGMTKPKKPAPKRPNECGILRSELQKMSVKERTRVYTRGTAMGLCGNCPQKWRPVVQFFLPNTRSEKTARRAAELQDASDDLKKMYEKGTKKPDDPKWQRKRDELVATIVKKRTTLCIECGKVASGISPAEKKCKQFWEFLKWANCKKNNGCANKDCTERGMSSWPVISADHGTNPKKCRLSDYTWWAWNGGVDAMLAESKKCTWPCMACHTLRPTGKAGKKRKPKTLPWEIACDERIQAKQDFNDALKMARSTTCEYDGCNYPITKETVRSIHWSHRDSTQKATHDTHPHLITKSSGGGVGAMIGNCALGAALDAKVPGDKSGRTNADDIKGETQKCDANCANCHSCRRGDNVDGSTNPVRGRWDVLDPEDNPWVQSALKQRPGKNDRIEKQRSAILKFESPIGQKK